MTEPRPLSELFDDHEREMLAKFASDKPTPLSEEARKNLADDHQRQVESEIKSGLRDEFGVWIECDDSDDPDEEEEDDWYQ